VFKEGKDTMTKKELKRRAPPVRILVLDILKPHKPNILEFGKAICKANSIESANLSVYAVDEKTESVKMILEGKNLNFDRVKELIESYGAVVHSMDKVILGKKKKDIEVP
jgi:hypothetical protein